MPAPGEPAPRTNAVPAPNPDPEANPAGGPPANPKPWGGRFTAATDRAVEAFTASIDVDRRLLEVDIRASQAHARMLGACGVLPPEEARTLVEGLDEVRRRVEAWRALGATHLAIDTMRAGFGSPKAHIEAIRSFRDVLS